MSIEAQERASESPYVEKVMHGFTLTSGRPIRPAEIHWHLVFVQHRNIKQMILVGPWSTSGEVFYGADAEILWVQLPLGTFMPHLPTKNFLNQETLLPNSICDTFWLHSTAWQFPNYDNVETFIDHLVRDEVLVVDPIVQSALQQQPVNVASRTVRHRFLQVTGLSQNHIFQVQRAHHAVGLLQQGLSILDVVFEAGYFDQPHLTRSLKQYIGYTPTQIAQQSLAT